MEIDSFYIIPFYSLITKAQINNWSHDRKFTLVNNKSKHCNSQPQTPSSSLFSLLKLSTIRWHWIWDNSWYSTRVQQQQDRIWLQVDGLEHLLCCINTRFKTQQQKCFIDRKDTVASCVVSITINNVLAGYRHISF